MISMGHSFDIAGSALCAIMINSLLMSQLVNVAAKRIIVTHQTGIYTIIILKSVCQCSQTAGRNSCSLISGDVSNCSYRPTVGPTSCHEFASQFDLAIFLYAKNSPNYREYGVARTLFISMNRRSAIVSPASKRDHPTMTESWLGAPTQRTATPTVVGGCVRARVCVCARACVRA